MAKFEVFISFKNTDDQGGFTRDRAMAESLYYALKKQGIRAFNSNISIKESGESSYRKAIDKALDESRVMVVVGTSIAHMTAPQLESEIEQFRNDMLNGVKPRGQSRLFTYLSSNIPVNRLPNGLRHYQSCCSEQDLVERICNFLKHGSGFYNMEQSPKQTYRGLSVGTVLDGKYKILNEIGRGGMSVVYLAVNEQVNRACAVKETRHDARNGAVMRASLMEEANLLKGLSHPNILHAIDVIDTPESFIIIMEYVEGSSLDKILQEQGPLEEEQVIRYARQLGEVLCYLHSRTPAVIYRDMKPRNIMLQPDGNLKLIDFGAAREYKDETVILTEDTTVLGTRGYAAPEQYGGMGQTDARTDIYTLGATLYHMLVGRSPAEPPYAMTPIRQCNPRLSRGMEYIVQKCTEADPDKRFQTAREFLDALDHIHELPKREKKSLGSLFRALKREQSQPPATGRRRPEPAREFAIPGAPAPRPDFIQTLPTPPVTRPAEFSVPGELAFQPVKGDIYSAETEPLKHPPEQPEPKPRKVTVRSKSLSNPELEQMVTKLSALDPESRKLVGQLIDQLSK